MDRSRSVVRLCLAACTFLVCMLMLQRLWKNAEDCSPRRLSIRLMPDDRKAGATAGKSLATEGSKGATSVLFILYSWNYSLLQTALQAYVAAGWGTRIIIIDNSPDKRILNDRHVNELVAEVIPTRPSRLSFSQLQNFIGEMAIERGYTYYFWGHADVALMATDATASHSTEVLGCMDKIMREEPDWGLAFFAHEGINCKDHLLATRTDVAKRVPYDTFITVYMSDCDLYPRVMSAGYKLVSYTDHCPGLDLKSFDLRRPVDLPVGDYEAMEKLLAAEERQGDRNAWKTKEWSRAEDCGWNNWEKASLTYYREKWNLTEQYNGWYCPDLRVPGEQAVAGRPVYREPFQGDPNNTALHRAVPAAPWCTRPPRKPANQPLPNPRPVAGQS